jgi:hypothetical protein
MKIHRIQLGDTLATLAQTYGTTCEQLRATNSHLDMHHCAVGTVVKIPSALKKTHIQIATTKRPTNDSRTHALEHDQGMWHAPFGPHPFGLPSLSTAADVRQADLPYAVWGVMDPSPPQTAVLQPTSPKKHKKTAPKARLDASFPASSKKKPSIKSDARGKGTQNRQSSLQRSPKKPFSPIF